MISALTALAAGTVSGVALADTTSATHPAARPTASDGPDTIEGPGGTSSNPLGSVLDSNHQSAEGRDGPSSGSPAQRPSGAAPASESGAGSGAEPSTASDSSSADSAYGSGGASSGRAKEAHKYDKYRPPSMRSDAKDSDADSDDEESDGPSHGGKGGKAGHNSTHCALPVGPGAKTTQCTRSKARDGADGPDQAAVY